MNLHRHLRPALACIALLAACKKSPEVMPHPERSAKVSSAAAQVSTAVPFNSTPIAAGSTLWFTSVFKISDVPAAGAKVTMAQQTITFTVNGVTTTAAVPESVVTISPAASSASTTFDAATGRWLTTLPMKWAGHAFVSAVEVPVATALPGGVTPTWSTDFVSDPAGVTINWQWSAAVYSHFSTDYNGLQVKVVESSDSQTSDFAGSPEAYRQSVVAGGTGAGGTNYTGSLGRVRRLTTQTCTAQCPVPDSCHDVSICDDSTNQCVASLMPNFCDIGGACVAAGAVNPQNQCQVCDPSADADQWSLSAACNAPPSLTVSAPLDGAKIAAASTLVAGKISGAARPFTLQIDGSAVPVADDGTFSASVALSQGANAIQLAATDFAGRTATATVNVRSNTVPPSLGVSTPNDGLVTNAASVAVTGTAAPADALDAVTVTVAGVAAPVGGGSFSASVPLASGANAIAVVATDGYGLQTTVVRSVTRDSTPPALAVTSPAEGARIAALGATVAGTASDDSGSVSVAVNGAAVPVSGGSFTAQVALVQGANAIAVVATDGAGNSTSLARNVRANVIPPSLSLSSPAEGLVTNAASIAVSGTASAADPLDTVTVLVNGSAVPVSGGAFSTSVALAGGSNTITVSATDGYGLSTSVTRHLTQDTTPPAVSISLSGATDGQATNAASVAVAYSVSDANLASVTAVFDGAQSHAASGSFTATAEGAHTLTVDATDAAGNASHRAVSFTIDRTPPKITLSGPAQGAYINTGATVSYTVDDPSAVVVARADGAPFSGSVALAAEGAHGVTVTATDAAGNTASASLSFTIDETPPTVSISGASDGEYRSGAAVIHISGADTNLASVTGTADGAPFSDTVTIAADGVHTVTARATDLAGNSASAQITFTIDSSAPVLTVIAPADGSYTNNPSLPVAVTAGDADLASVTANGAPLALSSGAYRGTVPLVDGVNTIALVATDLAHNQTTASVSVVLDRQPPALAVDAPADGAHVGAASVQVTGSVRDSSPLVLSVAGQPVAVATGGAFSAAVALQPGANSIDVVATDAAGNSSTVTRAVRSNTVAPVVQIAAPADGSYTRQTQIEVDAAAVAGDPGDTLNLVANGVAMQSGAATVPLSEGANLVTVTATDSYGLSGSASVTVYRDTVPPAVAIGGVSDGQVTRDAVVPSINVSDASPFTFTATLDGAPFTSGATVSAEGLHALVVSASDAAGNSASAQVSFTIDRTPPVISLLGASDGQVTASPVTLTWTASDATAVVVAALVDGAQATAPVTISAEGVHTARVTATDAAGNSSAAQVSFTIDRTKPQIAIAGVFDGEVVDAASLQPSVSVTDATATTVTTALDGAPFTGQAVTQEAEHLLAVSATDAAGNLATASARFTIDRTPPVIALSGVTNGEYRSGPASIAVSVTDATLDSFTALADGAPFTGSVTISGDGPHAVSVQASDRAGHTASAQVSFTIDSTKPVITVTTPADGSYTRDPSPPIAVNVGDDTGIASVTANGSALVYSAGAWRGTLSLADGFNAIDVAAYDLAGNRSDASLSVVLDRQAPALTVDAPVESAYVAAATVQVTGSVHDASPLALTVAGQAAMPAADGTFASAVALQPGANQIDVVATDAAGNVASISRHVRSNTVPPAVAITAPQNGLYTALTQIEVDATATPGDPSDTLQLSANGVAMVGGSAVVPLSEGANTIVVTATDSYGLSASVSVAVVRDTQPPVISLAGVSDGQVTSATPVPVFTASDANLAQVAATLDGAPFTSGTPVTVEGAHTLAIVATDAAGNSATLSASFVVDRTPPAIAIAGVADGQVTSANVAISVSVTDATATQVSAAVDGAPFTGSVTVSAEGVHHLAVSATDAAGNVSHAALSFTIDRTPPQIAISGVGDGEYTSAAAVAPAFQATDATGAAVSATLDGAPFASGTAVAAEGAHVLVVSASDAAGNTSAATVRFTIDRTAPTVSISGASDGDYRGGPTTVSVAASDANLASVAATADGAPFSGSVTLTADGLHVVRAQATDLAGNSASAQISFFIDSTKPGITIVTPADGSYTSAAQAAVAALVNDDGGIASVSANGSPLSLSSGAWRGSVALADGANVIDVSAVDLAGNRSDAQVNVVLDRAAPELTVDAPADGAFIAANDVVVSGSVRDGSPVTLSIAGHAASHAADGSFSATVPLQPGLNSFDVVATDAAGNATTVQRTVHSNTVAPSLSIASPAGGSYTAQAQIEVDVVASPGDPADTLQLSFNGAPMQGSSAVVALVEGANVLTVIATDSYGLTATASVTVFRDTVAPVISIAGVADGEVSAAASVTPLFSAADASPVTVSATLDGAPFASGTPVSGEGAHRLAVTATDAAGNSSAATARFTLDRTPPAIAITGFADGQITSSAVTVSVTASDATAATLAVAIDGFPAAAPFTVSAEGLHHLTADATDAAGNTAHASASFTIDRTPPAIAISGVSEGEISRAASLSPAFTVTDATATSVTAALDGAPFQSGAAVAAEGAHVLAVAATDAAGNSSSATVHFTLDRTPPSLAIAGVANGEVRRDAVTVSYTATDATALVVTATADGAPFTGSVLVSAEGQHLVAVDATDAAGNSAHVEVSFVIDRTPPAIAITGVSDGLYSNAASVTPSFSATDATLASVSALLDGSAFASGTPVAAEGAHVLSVSAADAAGNSSVSTVHFTLDRTPPSAAIAGVSDGDYRSGAATVSVSATDANLASVSSTADGTPFTGSVTISSDGPHTISVRAADLAGNSSSAQVSFVIDSSAPVVTIVSPADGSYTNNAAANVVVSTGQDPSIASVTANGTALALTGGQYTGTVALSDGPNVIAVLAIDRAGNQTRAQVSVTLDRQPPSLSLDAPAEGAHIAAATVEVTGSAHDASPLVLTVAGHPATPAGDGSFESTAALQAGANQIDVVATDAAGNATQISRNVRSNTVPPSVTIATPADGLYTTLAQIEVDASATPGDPQDALQLSVNGLPMANGVAVVPLAEGANTLAVTATDSYGLSAAASVTVTRDTIAPALSLAGVADGMYSNAAAVTPVFSATDASPVVVSATLDGAPFQSGTPVSAEGAHALAVSATDAAGNSSSLSAGFVLDRTPPQIALSGASDGEVRIAPATIVFSASDANLAQVSATADGAPFASGGTISAPGTHTIAVSATDKAGNGATARLGFTIVQPSLAVTIASPADGALTNAASIAVDATVASSAAVETVTANGAALAQQQDGSWSGSVALTEGVNSIVVVATDALGATGQASVSVTRDTQPPAVAITSPQDGAHIAANSVSVSGTASDANGVRVSVNGAQANVSAGAWTASVGLSSGSNVISATATDGAGNTAQASVTVRSNTTPPSLAVSAPVDGSTVTSAAVTVQGSASPADPQDSVSVTVNGAATQVNAGAFSAAATLVPGVNTLQVIATDGYGLTSTQTVHVTLQTTPSIVIEAPADGALLRDASIAVSGHLAGGTPPFVVTVDGSAAAVASSSFTANIAPSEGDHLIQVSATDATGAAVSASRLIHVDRTAPSLRITSPGSSPATVAVATYQLQGTVSDSYLASVTVGGNAVDFSGGQFSAPISLAPGVTDVAVVATDLAGNSTAVTQEFLVARLPPAIAIVSPADGSEADSATATVTAAVSSTSQLASVTIGGGAADQVAPGQYQAQVPLSLGDNTITATATDVFGLSATAQVRVHYRDAASEPLTVQAVSPASGTTDVLPDAIVSITFNKPFDNTTIAGNFTVTGDDGAVDGGWSISPSSQTASFVPRAPLLEGRRYVVSVAGVQPQTGLGMSGGFVSDFTTRSPLTLVRGLVLDEHADPAINALVTLEGDNSARTGIDGNFFIYAKSGGTRILRVEGGSNPAGAPYALSRSRIYVASGATTDVPPIVLIPLEAGGAQRLDTSLAQHVAFNNRYPGLALDIPAGAFALPDGTSAGIVSATRIPAYALPPPISKRPLVAGFHVEPFGARMSQPFTLQLPNLTGGAPGSHYLLYTYAPDLMELVPANIGTVSADGSVIQGYGTLNSRSIEYIAWAGLTPAEEAQLAAPPKQQSRKAPLSAALGHFGLRRSASLSDPFNPLPEVENPDVPDAYQGILEEISTYPTVVKGVLRRPPENGLSIVGASPDPATASPQLVTMPYSLPVSFSAKVDDSVAALSGEPVGVHASIAGYAQETKLLAPPVGENWDVSGVYNEAGAQGNVPLSLGSTRIVFAADSSVGDATLTFKAVLSVPDPAQYPNARPNQYVLTLTKDLDTSAAGLAGTTDFSGVKIMVGGDTATNNVEIANPDGSYLHSFQCFACFTGTEMTSFNIALLPLPPHPVQDSPGHFIMEPGMYSARSTDYRVYANNVAKVDIVVDARSLVGTVDFVDRTGTEIGPLCDDGQPTTRDAQGNITHLSPADVGTTDVHFFKAEDLVHPIAQYVAAGPIAQDGACVTGAHGYFERVRVGPGDFTAVQDAYKCKDLLAQGKTGDDFFVRECTPDGKRKDFMRVQRGDVLTVFAVNRATGYAGMKQVVVPAANDPSICGTWPSIAGAPPDVGTCKNPQLAIPAHLKLYPPEIDVRVERSTPNDGIAGTETRHLVRSGGAGTTRDDYLKVSTHWRVRLAPAPAADVVPPLDNDCTAGKKADGTPCDPSRIADQGAPAGDLLEVFCSEVPPGGDLTKCLKDDSELADVPPGVPPLAGRVWTQNGAASGEPLPTVFDVRPGFYTSLVNAAVPFRAADGSLQFRGNLGKANYFVHVVGKQVATNAPSAPDFTPEEPSSLGLPVSAIGLHNVYRALDGDGLVRQRFDRSREHQWSVVEVDNPAVTTNPGDANTRTLTGTQNPSATEDDIAYQLTMQLVEPTDVSRTPPPGTYQVRVGGDVYGIDCTMQIQGTGPQKSLTGTCGGDSLMDVLSAEDILYIELYLSGNAENVLYQFNFNGLTLRHEQVTAAMQTTAQKSFTSEVNGPRTPRRTIMQPSIAQFFVQPVELKQGMVELCLDEKCAAPGSVLKVMNFAWSGSDYQVTYAGGRPDLAQLPVHQRSDVAVDGATFYTIALPNDIAIAESTDTASSATQQSVYVRYLPSEPRLEPFSRQLGFPRANFQSQAARAAGQVTIDGVDIADGHLTLETVDLHTPVGGTQLVFSRRYNNQNDEIHPLGIGWTHNFEGEVLEERAGAYAVILNGQSYNFPTCTVVRDPSSGNPTSVVDCKSDLNHGGQLGVAVDASGAFSFAFVHPETRFLYKFDRPVALDVRTHRAEGGRRWLLTSVDDGLAMGPLLIKYLDDSDLVSRVEREDPESTYPHFEFTYEDPERLPGAHSRLLRAAHEQGQTTGTSQLVNLFLLSRVELKTGSLTIDSIELEHEIDANGQPTHTPRYGNLTGVLHTNAQGLAGPWRWDYQYVDPPSGAPADWALQNEVSEVDLSVNGVVQSRWKYQRNAPASPYDYIDKGQVISDVFAPGHGGKATHFTYNSDNTRQVTLPLPDGGATTHDFSLNAFGNAVSDQTPAAGQSSTHWYSDSDTDIVQPQASTSAAGLGLNMSYAGTDAPDPLAATQVTLASTPADALASPNVAAGTVLQTMTPDPRWTLPQSVTVPTTSGNNVTYTQQINAVTGLPEGLQVSGPGGTFAMGATTHDPFNAAPKTATLANGVTVTFDDQDDLGLPTKQTLSIANSTAIVRLGFDLLGRMTSRDDSATGASETWVYDALGRATEHTIAGQPAQDWTYTYDHGTELTMTVTATLNGAVQSVRTFYDGQLVQESWPWGTSGQTATVTNTYDAGYLKQSQLDPGIGDVILRSYSYDADGRQNLVQVNGATESSYTLDGDGRVKTITDRDGLVTTIGYDGAGRAVRWDYGGGDVVQAVRDASMGVITEETQGLNHHILIGHDATGRVISRTSAANPASYQVTYQGTDGLGRYTQMHDDGITETYEYNDAHGRMTKRHRSLDTTGATVDDVWTYAANGSGETVTQVTTKNTGTPATRMVTTVMDAAGRVISSTQTVDGQPVTVMYAYDAQGNLATVTDPDGTTTLSYDANHKLVQAVDPLQRTVKKTLDALGRVWHVDGPRGEAWDFAYDAFGRLKSGKVGALGGAPAAVWTTTYAGATVTSVDPAGVTTVRTHNARGLDTSVSVSGASGGSTLTALDYDGAWMKHSRVSEGASVVDVNASFDDRGRTLSRSEVWQSPAGAAYSYQSTANYASPLTPILTDAWHAGSSSGTRTANLTVDGLGNVVLREIGGVQDTAIWDAEGMMVSSVQASLAPVNYVYEEGGRLRSRTQGSETTSLSYYPDGTLKLRTDPDGRSMSMTYDAGRRVKTAAYGIGTEVLTTTYAYADAGSQPTSIDRMGSVTAYAYGGRGELTSVTQPDGSSFVYHYNADDTLSAVDAPGHASWETFQYDYLKRPTYRARGSGMAWTTGWSSATATTTDAEGNSAVAVFDPRGRMSRIDYRAGPKSVAGLVSIATDYTDLGQPAQVVETYGAGTATTSYQFDALGRVHEVDRTAVGGAVTDPVYEREPWGAIKSVTVPDGVVRYGHDSTYGRLSSIQGKAGVTTVSWEAGGSRLVKLSGGGLDEARCYTPQGFLQAVAIGSQVDASSCTGNVLQRYDYDYDTRGNRTSEAFQNGQSTESVAMGYDLDNRLTGVRFGDATATLYAYDALGSRVGQINATSYPVTAPLDNSAYGSVTAPHTTRTFVLDDSEQLTGIRDGAALVGTVIPDKAGRVQEYDYLGTTRRLSWDAAGRMVRADVQLPAPMAQQTVTYDYDFRNWRTASTIAGQQRSFVWSEAGEVVDEQGPAGNHLYEKLGGIVTATDGTRAAHDGSMSITGYFDGTSVQKQRRYDPFGAYRSGAPASSEPQAAYAGQDYDADVGLSYAQQRWYAPDLGRFLSEDPVMGTPGNPVSLNPFTYANDNPQTYTDADGRSPTVGVGLITGAIGAASGCVIGAWRADHHKWRACAKGGTVGGASGFMAGLTLGGSLAAGGAVLAENGVFVGAGTLAKAGGIVILGAGASGVIGGATARFTSALWDTHSGSQAARAAIPTLKGGALEAATGIVTLPLALVGGAQVNGIFAKTVVGAAAGFGGDAIAQGIGITFNSGEKWNWDQFIIAGALGGGVAAVHGFGAGDSERSLVLDDEPFPPAQDSDPSYGIPRYDESAKTAGGTPTADFVPRTGQDPFHEKIGDIYQTSTVSHFSPLEPNLEAGEESYYEGSSYTVSHADNPVAMENFKLADNWQADFFLEFRLRGNGKASIEVNARNEDGSRAVGSNGPVYAQEMYNRAVPRVLARSNFKYFQSAYEMDNLAAILKAYNEGEQDPVALALSSRTAKHLLNAASAAGRPLEPFDITPNLDAKFPTFSVAWRPK